MLDSLTSSIATILNAKRDTAFQKNVDDSISEIKDVIHYVAEALYQTYDVIVDNKSNTEDFQAETLNDLVDIYSEIIDKADENPEESSDLSDLGSEIAADMVAVGEGTDDESAATFESMDKSLQSLVKLNQTQLNQETKMGKLLNKVEKTIGSDEKKTKTANELAPPPAPPEPEPPDPSKFDMSSVAKSMAAAAAAALSPFKLIKAFFTEVLPYLILLGILLYGFVTGYLEGDVYDFLLYLGGIIIAGFLAYLAYQYIKAAILLAFQMACELVKVALAAHPALLAMVAVGIIVTAFLLVAAVLLILFSIAFLLIAAGVAILIVAIGKVLVDLVKTIVSIPLMILESFAKIISILFGGSSGDEDSGGGGVKKLIKDGIIPKMDQIIAALLFGKKVEVKAESAEKKEDDGLSSNLKQFTDVTDELADKISDLTNEGKNEEIDVSSISGVFSCFDTISTNVATLVGLVQKIVDNNSTKESEIIKQAVSSALDQRTNSMENNYQITDGQAVLSEGTAVAQSEGENNAATGDITQVITQLTKIIGRLNDIYDTEKEIAENNDKPIWSGLFS